MRYDVIAERIGLLHLLQIYVKKTRIISRQNKGKVNSVTYLTKPPRKEVTSYRRHQGNLWCFAGRRRVKRRFRNFAKNSVYLAYIASFLKL